MYTCLQIFALIRSMSQRVIELDMKNKKLKLRFGFFAQTEINTDHIKSIESYRKALPDKSPIIKLSSLGILDSHNVKIELTERYTLEKLYGMKTEFQRLVFYIDEPAAFINSLYPNQ